MKYEIKERIIRMCCDNNYFTLGSREAYCKMLDAAAETATIHDIAVMIWVCSENVELSEIERNLEEIRSRVREYVEYHQEELQEDVQQMNYYRGEQSMYAGVVSQVLIDGYAERAQHYAERANRLAEELNGLRRRWGV